MEVIIKVVLLLVFLATCNGRSLSREEEEYLGREKHLQSLNKPAVKTIQTKYGDTIDCVDINKQPAFDHPLLKNHTIQITPSFIAKWKTEEASLYSAAEQIGFQDPGCPEGTIPIIRVRINKLVGDHSLSNLERMSLANVSEGNNGGFHWALLLTSAGKYYGGQGFLNLWGPKVGDGYQYSSSMVGLLAGPQDNNNILQAGWNVSPSTNKDKLTRFFVAWQVNGEGTTKGCENLNCPGFVQVSKVITPGIAFQPLSAYNGKQYEIKVTIRKDQFSGNWWVVYGADEAVGYWPKSLFTFLADSSKLVTWGGRAGGPPNGPSAPMGSGHFPEEDFRKASYIRQLKIIDNLDLGFYDPSHLDSFSDAPKCYKGLDTGKRGSLGRTFFFGGPGDRC